MTTNVSTVSADDLVGDEASPQLASIYFREGESKILRFVTKTLNVVGLHFRKREEAGTARPFLCRGAGECATCLGGQKPIPTYLLSVLYVPTRTMGVMSFGEANGPDSLRRQTVSVLRLVDFTQKIIEVSLFHRKYTVKILRTIGEAEDGEAFGLDILRDIEARGGLTQDAVVATVDQLTNAEMLEESPSLRREIELRNPGFDVTAL